MRKSGKLGILAEMIILTAILLFTALPASAKADKAVSCLFIGNSVSYYNNMPEMYGKIVSEATGKNVTVTTLMAAGKQLHDFSFNVGAVVHSKGNFRKLNKNELYYMDRSTFNKKLFNAYKKVLLDKNGKVRHYDYIILQDHGRQHSYEYSRLGALNLVRLLADKETTVVLFMPNYHVTPEKDLDIQKKRQNKDDKIAGRIVKDLKSSGLKYKAVAAAYSGKAFFNYFYAYGFHYASRLSPKDYKLYKDSGEYLSDLVVDDEMHSTQLGAYLHAATIYSAVYKKSAADTVKAYQAETTFKVPVLHRYAKGRNYAMENGPFRNKKILKKICYIADQTQNKGMDFTSRGQAKQWNGLR